MRVYFQTWGKLSVGDGYAIKRSGESMREAALRSVTRRLERQHGVQPWGYRPEGTALHNGIPEADHYQATCGTPAPGGGLNVSGEIWVSVPWSPEGK